VRQRYYFRRVTEVASRDLRCDTADVLSRVQAGEDIVITVNRKPVARVVPIGVERRSWLAREELLPQESSISVVMLADVHTVVVSV
jgi:prevent-host-death family protein